MDIKESLADFKRQIDREIEIYLDKKIRETRKRDIFVADALVYVKKTLLAGGKRLRPALMYWGYVGAGGKEKEEMLKTAVAIELVHTFLLIHDDIMDRDFKRHGIDTVNAYYQKIARKHFKNVDNNHFGNSMAIIIGDMIGALGNQILFDSSFDSKIVMKALSKLQDIISLTVVGQSKDVYMEYRKKATEKEVLAMYEYKTAKYTLEGPLHLGGILGGADEKILKGFSAYAIPLGIAFQIQDDILGIFGAEKKLGKPVGSDIEEEKQTLLLVKAKEWATREQKKTLENILSKEAIESSDVKEFQKIIIETGALSYAQNLAEKYIVKGKTELEKVNISADAKEFFLGVADYMVARNI